MALGEWEFQDGAKTSPIISGKIKRAKKVIIYGPEGIGKSTFASWFPKPLVIDVERSADELEVDKIDCRDKTYNEICDLIGEHGFDYQTIIIDTFDWFEEKIIEHVCKEGGDKKSIEDFGYGKGFIFLAEETQKLLARFEKFIDEGIHVVFVCHSEIKKYEQPDQEGSYDRFQLKLSKHVSPLIREWANMVLFENWAVTVKAETDRKGNVTKAKGKGGRSRLLHTTHHAAYDAKNRYGLPDTIAVGTSLPEQIAVLLEIEAPVEQKETAHVAEEPKKAPAKPVERVPKPEPEPEPEIEPEEVEEEEEEEEEVEEVATEHLADTIAKAEAFLSEKGVKEFATKKDVFKVRLDKIDGTLLSDASEKELRQYLAYLEEVADKNNL